MGSCFQLMGDPQFKGIPSTVRWAESQRTDRPWGLPWDSTPLSQRNPDSALSTEPKAWPFQSDSDGREPKPGNAGIRPAREWA